MDKLSKENHFITPKYIRTPTTIFEVVSETDEAYRVRSKKDPESIYSKSKIQTEVLVSSDFLYSLLDEIVLTHYFPETCYLSGEIITNKSTKTALFESTKLRLKNNINDFNIYGGIWTNKGLVYVAKMGLEGDFELL